MGVKEGKREKSCGRERVEGGKERKKKRGDGETSREMEKGKEKVRTSSTIKREACLGKAPLPGTREGHGALGLWRAASVCAVSFRLTFGQTVWIFEAISPDFLAAAPGNLPSKPSVLRSQASCTLILKDST